MESWQWLRGFEFVFVPLKLMLIPASGLVAGWVCAFFWHPIADRITSERWGAFVLLLIFAPAPPLAPLLSMGAWSWEAPLFWLIITLPFALASFHRGVHIGFRWWGEGYWRHFVGLANDYEREEQDK